MSRELPQVLNSTYTLMIVGHVVVKMMEKVVSKADWIGQSFVLRTSVTEEARSFDHLEKHQRII